MKPPDELFNIQVNEEGRQSILKTQQLMRWVFGITVLSQAAMLYYTISEMVRYSGFASSPESPFYWYVRINIIYTVMYVVLSVLQILFLLKFSNKAGHSVQINDSNGFNNALPWIHRSLRMAIVNAVLTGIYFIYVLNWGI